MRVLVACEHTQRVCTVFRGLGHEAYSCDVDPCTGDMPQWHIQDDVRNILGKKWDVIIGFPPCTDLSCACANLWPQKIQDGRVQVAFDLVLDIWEAGDRVCIENPQGWLNTNWRKPDQVVHPHFFGDPYLKRTCLWLKGLSKLYYLLNDTPLLNMMGVYRTAVDPISYWVSSSNRKDGGLKNGVAVDPRKRAETFPGVARAMGEAWG